MSQPSSKQATILVIDDESHELTLLTVALTRRGYRVQQADNGPLGLELARSAPPDLILLDIMMPDMDGYQVCRRLKEDAKTGDIPVIVISALERVDDKIEAFSAGAVDYIPKPFVVSEMLARVKTHLALRAAQKQLEEKSEIIEQLNESLEQRVIRRTQALQDEIAQHKQTEALLQEQRAQSRLLAARLTEVEEIERRQLARELHDLAGQNLTALSVTLKIAQTQISNSLHNQELSEQLTARLDDASDLIKETTKRIRNVMDNLRPPALEDYGLLAALRWYGEEFSARTNISVAVRGEALAPRPAASVEAALFRIVQEALTNVARHAQAAQAVVTVETDLETIRMVIADDGIGFDTEGAPKSDHRQRWGLLTMVERAEAVGGSCWVESLPAEGTKVIVEVEL